MAESDCWPRIAFTPTVDPLTELAARLAALGGGNAVEVRDSLLRHPGQAHLPVWQAVLAQRPAEDRATRLVLIVDQFEQLFTLNPGPEGEPTRRAFIAALHAAATMPVGPSERPAALVVIAVRGDFCDRCSAYPELADALQHGQFVVGPMTESDLRLAITGPAEAAGLRIDPVLTGAILADLRAAGRDQVGVLPLLSQAMALTWDKRDGDRLTSRGYDQAGGVSRAVQSSADAAYAALDRQQQALARDLLRAMTIASRDGRLTRRPVSRTELYAGRPDADRSRIDVVLEAFAAQRLVILNDHKAQLSHDVLLTAWPRLQGWLDDDRASWILHGQLTADADTWEDSDQDPSFLYRGTQLTTVRQAVVGWAANPARYPALTSAERNFLDASAHAAARTTRRRRGAVALLALLTVAALIASGAAYQQRSTAIGQRDTAIYNNTIAQALQVGPSDPSLAAQLTLAADKMRSSQALTTRLLSLENTPLSTTLPAGTDSKVSSVAFSPDGRILATGGLDGSVQLWDTADPAKPRRLSRLATAATRGGVFSVAFSPNGDILASGDDNGTIQLWDTTSPAHSRPLPATLAVDTSGTPASSVAFTPDSRTLATGSADATTRLWDLDVNDAIGRICATTGNNLTYGVWQTYMPQLPYRPPCG